MKLLRVVILFLLGLICTKGQAARKDFQPLPIMEWPKVLEPIPSLFNMTYSDTVSSDDASVYAYEQNTESGAVKVIVWSKSATVENPILVVIKRHHSVLSWQVPLVLEESYSYYATSRTLCPMKNHFLPAPDDSDDDDHDLPSVQVPVPNVENFFVEILTLSDEPIPFSVRVETNLAFIKNGDTSFIMEASPAAPQYIQYNMRPNSTRVLVKLEATEGESFCGYLSLQSVHCPVGDLESDLRLDGRFQTVRSRGAVEVHRDHFKESMFYIVVLVHSHDDCDDAGSTFLGPFRPRPPYVGNSTETSERKKVVRITVTDTVDSNTIVIAVAVPIFVHLVFFVLTVILLQTSCSNWKALLRRDLSVVKLPAKREEQWRLNYLCDHNIRGQELRCQWMVEKYERPENSPAVNEPFSPPDARNINSDTRGANLTSETEQPLLSPTRHSYHFETRHVPSVAEGDNRRPSSMVADQRLFFDDSVETSRSTSSQTYGKWQSTAVEYGTTLISVFVFYALPVLQLVMTHQGLLLLTGNQDLCYYNFSCSNRLGILSDFNHIISNVGYIILGFLFVVQVRRRSVFTSKLGENLRDLKDLDIHKFGPPNQFGLLYGMGLALIMEGLMSSFYHICPSYSNFQFDTSFMYLISGLLILKLRHSRHRNILPRSYKAYSIFAVFIFVSVLGVVLKQYWYWIAFSVAHVVFTVIMVLHILLEDDESDPPKHVDWGNWKLATKPRIVIASLISILNVGFAVAGPVLGGVDFASHLLFVLQGNLLVYAVFYMVMKLSIPEEKVSIGTLIYFLLALPAWIAGLYFFVAGLTDWKVSPALSREGNKDCFLYNFYDEHDVWHTLSAFGLFFTFMTLLTLDDDIATTPWKYIIKF